MAIYHAALSIIPVATCIGAIHLKLCASASVYAGIDVMCVCAACISHSAFSFESTYVRLCGAERKGAGLEGMKSIEDDV